MWSMYLDGELTYAGVKAAADDMFQGWKFRAFHVDFNVVQSSLGIKQI